MEWRWPVGSATRRGPASFFLRKSKPIFVVFVDFLAWTFVFWWGGMGWWVVVVVGWGCGVRGLFCVLVSGVWRGWDPGGDLLLHGLGRTTIGAGAFHFRVRDGIGWFHAAMAARKGGWDGGVVGGGAWCV